MDGRDVARRTLAGRRRNAEVTEAWRRRQAPPRPATAADCALAARAPERRFEMLRREMGAPPRQG
jgi:hypothetical protein